MRIEGTLHCTGTDQVELRAADGIALAQHIARGALPERIQQVLQKYGTVDAIVRISDPGDGGQIPLIEQVNATVKVLAPPSSIEEEFCIDRELPFVEKDRSVIWRNHFPLADLRVTDAALALQHGTVLEILSGVNLKFAVLRFASPPAGNRGASPEIDRNPYNFVAFGPGPAWLERPDHPAHRHPGHDRWHSDLFHGYIDFTLESLSPVFTPRREDKSIFYRLHRWIDGSRQLRYAVPGSGWKGSLRSMVEALANDRMGVIANRETYRDKFKYGRRTAKWSILQVAGQYFPPEPEERALGLSRPLGMAERMFGFVSDHDEKGSHPFRGKIRVEAVWGPPVDSATMPIPLDLAPLTAPQSRGKCQPLYLVGRSDGKSASYSDQTAPTFRGRKFYWRQHADGGIWPHHTKSSLHDEGQCPPQFCALPAETRFSSRLHFENLSSRELGALLYALLGFAPEHIASDGTTSSGAHTVQLGKAKPRGLGTCRVSSLKLFLRSPGLELEYSSLVDRVVPKQASQDEIDAFRRSFANWCEDRAGTPEVRPSFLGLPHIRDFRQLHLWPGHDSVRYYPINWSQYSAPVGPPPPAMKPARDLDP